MLTPARLPKRSPRRLRKFYAIIVKVFTPARVAKLADARDLKSRVPKGTYRFNSDPGHQRRIWLLRGWSRRLWVRTPTTTTEQGSEVNRYGNTEYGPAAIMHGGWLSLINKSS